MGRIRALVAQRRVSFTLRAFRELAWLGMGLEEEEARDVLTNLAEGEFVERVRSKSTGEWMYVFKPEVGGIPVYLKVILRTECVVISCHEEEDERDEDE